MDGALMGAGSHNPFWIVAFRVYTVCEEGDNKGIKAVCLIAKKSNKLVGVCSDTYFAWNSRYTTHLGLNIF
jgi:hypothetical protein